MPTNDPKNVPSGPLAPGQRWSLARKREVALRLLRGEPFGRQEVEAMSAAISMSTARPYGVKRVCSVWRVARSTFYALPAGGEPARRGPAPEVCDEELYAMIEDDLERSPFIGEGHRPVWARLRVSDVRVARRRVLRLMREHDLLSPRRVRKGESISHEGTITTDAPDDMWGTDGTRILTADEGMCWIFTAVDHFNCEVVGHHVCKRGDRFRNQVRFWGVQASYAFIEQPQTNGVAERFFRTLKEQVIYGRVYRNVAEVRRAVDTFIALYNEQWLPEKKGFMSPSATREAWYARQAQAAVA